MTSELSSGSPIKVYEVSRSAVRSTLREVTPVGVPNGLARVPGPGDRVGASVRSGLLVVMWFGALLLVGIGAWLLVDAAPGLGSAGTEVPFWASLMLIVFGLSTGRLAWAAARPKYLVTDEGFVSNAVLGKVLIRWDHTERISLSQPRGNALWFDAPGGIEHRGRVSRKKRISANIGGLKVHNQDLLRYATERWSKARSARDGSSTSPPHSIT